MLVVNQSFNNLVVIIIIMAGIMVGVQTYPSMSRNTDAFEALDYFVQCIFTLDCLLKIFQEGPRPHLYWSIKTR